VTLAGLPKVGVIDRQKHEQTAAWPLTGVPSDKHNIFRVNNGEGGERVTQFGHALEALNIDIICANSPQAKGRVEPPPDPRPPCPCCGGRMVIIEIFQRAARARAPPSPAFTGTTVS